MLRYVEDMRSDMLGLLATHEVHSGTLAPPACPPARSMLVRNKGGRLGRI